MKNLLSILKMDFVETNQTGKNLRSCFCLLSCLILVFGSSFQSLAYISSSSNAFTVNSDYLISTGSNSDPYGLMTMDLTDEDYGIAPASTLGTVTNTIGHSGVDVLVYYYDANGTSYSKYAGAEYRNGRFYFSASVPSTYYFYRMEIYIPKRDLPSPGVYNMSFDFASDFSYDVQSVFLWSQKEYNNAAAVSNAIYPDYDYFSGDVYFSNYKINLTSVRCLNPFIHIKNANTLKLRNLGGSFAVRFEASTGSGDSTAGTDTSESDYYSDMSNSLDSLSSSLDSAAENLEYISTSQNLIIQGIDNVIMHISDQLYAFWDQLYNLIHEPTYARLGDILDAIRNLDLEITVEMKEVTDAVNKMNQDMQNKLQNVQQTITQGFDNSVMESEASKLDQSLSDYEDAEQVVIGSVNDHLNEIELDAGLDEYKSIILVISDFIQALYEDSGGFQVLINLSILLSFAGAAVGLYRFGGGN